MTVQPLRAGASAHRKEVASYMAVLSLIIAASVIAGLLSNPAVGVAAFVALGNLLLPKRAPFWHKHRD